MRNSNDIMFNETDLLDDIKLEIENFGLTKKDILHVINILDKKVSGEEYFLEISLKSKIEKFLKLFLFLEEKKPTSKLKIFISNKYPLPWKKILIDILGQLEINSTINKFAQDIKNTLEAREIQLIEGASFYETGPKGSESVIVHLPMFIGDNPGTLSDGFYLENKYLGFTSFGGGRSAFTRTLEQIHAGKGEVNNNKLWYVNYPRDGKFNIQNILDDLVEKIQREGIKSISIHGGSMGGKVALELASRLADKSIKINKLFITDGALDPDLVSLPLWLPGWAVKTGAKADYLKNQLLTPWYETDPDREINDKDLEYWTKVNSTEGVSIEQINERLNYLGQKIDFRMRSRILQENVGEVIVLNSIPKEGAESDGMVLVNFPDYLKEIFGEKVKVIKVQQRHYMIPNSPGVYAKGLSK